MSTNVDLKKYLDEVQAHLATKEAREHTYRPAQILLFDSFGDIKTANDQARTKHGATDYVFRKRSNNDVVLGYGEAKDINVDLDKVEKTEQLERYSGYNNLILTNYIEFRFFQNGKKYAQIEIATLDDSTHTITPLPENFAQLEDEITAFFMQPPEVLNSAKRLSEIMGAKARRIRRNIGILLEENKDNPDVAKEIAKVFGLMRELLVHDLKEDKFADMYAQTLVYGLFVARYGDESPESFSREEARDLVPPSNPFLREFFDHIAGPRFEKGLAIIVDELCQVFSVSDVAGIIDKYLKLNDDDRNDAKDPIIHFYEDFLAEYDPEEKKKMGAYYTPTPVVRYMVRAVDRVLKEHFGISKGLADSSKEEVTVELQGKKVKQSYHRVQILDPATGTGTFLNEIIKYVHESFKGQEGIWPAYAREDLIPRLHGFELMMGAYTIAHLKLGLTLKSLGVDDFGKRLGVYLTNSLEEGVPQKPDLFSFGLAEAVTHEASEAAHIKSERPIMVVIGNPPYSGVSSNETKYANSLVNKYKVEPGGKEKLKERKHWLNDDYVKFIALAEDLIAKNGEGILAFITNNGYLDNPTFRGMRWHLTQTFDTIEIINLHGNSNKKEVSPDGSKDENVFDIQQGVSIIVAAKTRGAKKGLAASSVVDLFGKRRQKYEYLNQGELDLKKIQLDQNFFSFVDINNEFEENYRDGFYLRDLFSVHNTGIVTAMDKVVLHFTKKQAIESGRAITESVSPYEEFGIKDWRRHKKEQRLEEFRAAVLNQDPSPILYRPFDIRYLYYTTTSECWINSPRFDVMKHLYLNDNYGLIIPKLSKNDWGAGVTDVISGHKTVSAYDSNSVFPLWLYDENGSRSSNLDPTIVEKIIETAPEANDQSIFDYIYGTLHWPQYREKYKELLKTDFPRVPYPKDQTEFERFRAVGEKLRGLHLMTDPVVNERITTYPEAGSNEVEKITYKDNKVFINTTQYFGQVPPEAWEFYIGGYQPAQKWLKDRKGRTLSRDDLDHYQKIIKVLTETHHIMAAM